MPTIHDVARKAGVAPITVSRVINKSGYISQETRVRVEEAISELGYVPNTLARSLRSKRTNTLALILTDITNPFFTTLARGVEDAASDAGYTVIFCNTDESPTEEKKYLQVLLQKQVDGILLVPARSSGESVELVQKHGTPVVVIDRHVKAGNVDVVRGDSLQGSYALTKLLLDLGHRRLAIISGPKDVSTSEDRVEGFRQALSERQIPVDSQMVYYGGYTQKYGYDITRKILELPNRPTGIVAANNFISLGSMKALLDAGMRVPEDIALVGFDDLPSGMVIFPFFTVAAQPAYQMGQTAFKLLLARLHEQEPGACKEIILPVEIIVRQSSGEKIA